jgi:hypothetical protein
MSEQWIEIRKFIGNCRNVPAVAALLEATSESRFRQGGTTGVRIFGIKGAKSPWFACRYETER